MLGAMFIDIGLKEALLIAVGLAALGAFVGSPDATMQATTSAFEIVVNGITTTVDAVTGVAA